MIVFLFGDVCWVCCVEWWMLLYSSCLYLFFEENVYLEIVSFLMFVNKVVRLL